MAFPKSWVGSVPKGLTGRGGLGKGVHSSKATLKKAGVLPAKHVGRGASKRKTSSGY